MTMGRRAWMTEGLRDRVNTVRTVLLLALASTLVAACERLPIREDPAVPVGTEIGERAPPITGTAADGRPFDFRPDNRTATVLVFYRSYHCGLCRERLREIEQHLDEYRAVRAHVIAVSPDSLPLVRRAAEELGLTYPLVAADPDALGEWDVFGNGEPLSLPASYLLDPRGVVTYRHVGRNAADRASDLELLATLRQMTR
jgi:peroxiredoxin